MPTTLTASSILEALHDEKLGYGFGLPERIGEDSLSVVVPIIRESPGKRQYILYQETDQVSITDTGSINAMLAVNNGKDTVFLRHGTIFKGATQERALTRSAVIAPGHKARLEVRCVHASKGIRQGAEVQYGGVTPNYVDSTVTGSNFTPRDQNEYWREVANFSAMNMRKGAEPQTYQSRTHELHQLALWAEKQRQGELSFSSVDFSSSIAEIERPIAQIERVTDDRKTGGPGLQEARELIDKTRVSDDLRSTIESVASDLDAVLKKVKLHENQAGIALITERGLESIEVFDFEETWRKFHEDGVKRLGLELNRKDFNSVFTYDPDKAIGTIKDVLRLPFEQRLIFHHRPSNGDPDVKIFGLTHKEMVGEVVELDGKAMHLVILRTA